MFKGSIVALITPFRNGEIDEAALTELVEWHIAQGTNGIVPCGTTGESPTLTHSEHRRVVEIVVQAARARVPVMAGAGSNATHEAVDFITHASEAGADAALIVTPYYNKPTQAGLYAHFAALNEASRIPLYIYNIPSRSVIDMSVETMAALAKLPNIAGVKDATGDMARVSAQRAACGADFVQLSGNDDSALGFNAHGGVGCISVTANIAPDLCAAFQAACLAGEWEVARGLHDRLAPLHDAMFVEASPAPVKFAAHVLGLCEAAVRLPLVAVSAGGQEAVRAAMRAAKIGA